MLTLKHVVYVNAMDSQKQTLAFQIIQVDSFYKDVIFTQLLHFLMQKMPNLLGCQT